MKEVGCDLLPEVVKKESSRGSAGPVVTFLDGVLGNVTDVRAEDELVRQTKWVLLF